MRRFQARNIKGLGAAALLALLALAGVAWLERTPLLVWHYARQLARAGDADRDASALRLAGMDADAVPALLDFLRRDDARVCANALAALDILYRQWAPADPRRAALANQLADTFAAMSVPGRQGVLTLATGWLAAAGAGDAALTAAARVLTEAARPTDPRLQRRALDQATLLVNTAARPEILAACRAVTVACLENAEPETRLRALQLALNPHISLPQKLVPLLNDPVPEIRRAALLAVGARPELLDTDDLLQWLHDPDVNVCHLCEKALRSRGLREEDLKLGRLKTDRDPRVRLQVVQRLPYVRDLDPGIWLRNLSHDPDPAVRAAALRAAAESNAVDFNDRMDQMVQNDPSPTIRQIARFYLSCQKPPDLITAP